MSEDGHQQDGNTSGSTSDVPRCPYGHAGWLYKRFGVELVCAKCGVRVGLAVGRQID